MELLTGENKNASFAILGIIAIVAIFFVLTNSQITGELARSRVRYAPAVMPFRPAPDQPIGSGEPAQGGGGGSPSGSESASGQQPAPQAPPQPPPQCARAKAELIQAQAALMQARANAQARCR